MKCLNCGNSLTYKKTRISTTIGIIDDCGNLLDGIEKAETSCRVTCSNCGHNSEYGIKSRCCANCELLFNFVGDECSCLLGEKTDNSTKYKFVCTDWKNGVPSKRI